MFLILEKRNGLVTYGVEESVYIVGIANAEKDAIEILKMKSIDFYSEEIPASKFEIKDEVKIDKYISIYTSECEMFSRKYIELNSDTEFPVEVSNVWYEE